MKELKAAERRVAGIKKKAVQLSNNDLMEVFLLRKEEEAAKMDGAMKLIQDAPSRANEQSTSARSSS